MKRALAAFAAALILMAVVASPLAAQGNNSKPSISAAASDPAQTTLFVNGANFAADAQVYLGGVPLGGVVVVSGGTQLTAVLPAGLLPGSYRITIVQHLGSPYTATFDVALGSTGAEGPVGPAGPPGPQGDQGQQGDVGDTGATGATGSTGSTGSTGATGAQGIQGDLGPTGSTGPQGLQGDTGAQGAQGIQGVQGDLGPIGLTGSQGLQGDTGATGAQGVQGIQGEVGATGATGPIGPQGLQGDTGAQGLQGIQGVQGDLGPIGPIGPTGAIGPLGPTGPQGLMGANGATGPIGPTGPFGATGATGANGPQGATGATGVQGATGATGQQGVNGATGATGAQGATGVTGPQGAVGPNGPQGIVGATGATGANGATGPQGAIGPTGPQGANGAAGAIGPTGPQGANGTAGAIGPTGPQGVQGPAGSANINGTTNFIPKFTSATTGGNSAMVDDGSGVGIGTTAPAYPFQVIGTADRNIDVANSNSLNDAIWGVNTAAASNGTGSGVFGVTSQASADAAGLFGRNLNTIGTGVIGAGNNGTWWTMNNGSGGAFTGTQYGVLAKNTNATGVSAALYADNAGDVVQVAHYNGSVFYKILGLGTVSTHVKDPTDATGERRITLHAPESPEINFIDYGTAHLVNGRAHVELDPRFAANVQIDADHPMRVFVQIENDENIKGVIVKNKTATGFDVIEIGGGTSDATFQWQIVANRADEEMSDGRRSKNADARFEEAPKNHGRGDDPPGNGNGGNNGNGNGNGNGNASANGNGKKRGQQQ